MSFEEAKKQTIDCKICGLKDEEPILIREDWGVWRPDDDSQRRREVGICSTCDFWIEKFQMRTDEKVARINGQHYMYGDSLQDYDVDPNDSLLDIVRKWQPKRREGLGMSGQKVLIKFNDGRIIMTNDLWHQGQIPERFKNVLPDNAEMEAVA